jgi:pyruvate dehydrogenase E1 component
MAVFQEPVAPTQVDLQLLDRIQQRVLWLSTYLIHYANHVRPSSDPIKVGGHQASCASVVSMLTAYYFAAAEPGDVIAIKPHASPVFHAIQYLLGNLTREKLVQYRSFGGLQAYPSRLKDPDGVQISTGSVGFGAVMPNFLSLVRRYAEDHFNYNRPHRFLAVMGDAELDEGNVWEALGEESLQRLGGVIWMVDLNRQSLDRVVPSGREQKIAELLRAFGCHVIEVKYGSRLEAMFAQDGGARLRERIDQMSNDEYQSLLRIAEPERLMNQLCRVGGQPDAGLQALLHGKDPGEIASVFADLGGHDLGKILRAFEEAKTVTDRPVAIIAYTVKGWGLPLAGDPANHSRQLTDQQIEELRGRHGIVPGAEFDTFPNNSTEAAFCAATRQRLADSARARGTGVAEAKSATPKTLDLAFRGSLSTQQAFGNIVSELARYPEIRQRLVTVSPDVAVSTNLAGWIQKAGVYSPELRTDYFGDSQIPVAVKWKQSPQGQHLELGISENNLFLLLGALGVSGDLFGEPLLPIGTIYDTFISRGLDALHYAIYNGAKFILVGTPSGISLSAEGGLHQSLLPPSFGIESPRLTYYEPCFAQELEWILLEAVRRVLESPESESCYLRLSTVPVQQDLFPARDGGEMRCDVLRGGYRLIDHRGRPGYQPGVNVVNLFTCGPIVPIAVEASNDLAGDELFVNVFNVTSPDLLHRGWVSAGRARMNGHAVSHHLEELIPEEERHCPLVTVMDGHPHALSFLGSVFGAKTVALGVDQYGQSGSRQELYDYYQIGLKSIVRAAVEAIS